MTKLEKRKSALIALILSGNKPSGRILTKLINAELFGISGWNKDLLKLERMKDLKDLYNALN